MSAPENPAAFPRAASHISDSMLPLRSEDFGETGMTLRDYFAGQAISGLLAANGISRGYKDGKAFLADVSDVAFNVADAMLAERARRGKAGASK